MIVLSGCTQNTFDMKIHTKAGAVFHTNISFEDFRTKASGASYHLHKMGHELGDLFCDQFDSSVGIVLNVVADTYGDIVINPNGIANTQFMDR